MHTDHENFSTDLQTKENRLQFKNLLRIASQRAKTSRAILESPTVLPTQALITLQSGQKALLLATTGKTSSTFASQIQNCSSYEEIQQELFALESAIKKTKTWYRHQRSGAIRRALHLSTKVFSILVSIFLVFFIGWGVFNAFTIPNKNQGLLATYYAKSNYKGLPFMRVDHAINFNWKKLPPAKGLPQKNFSVKWKGCLRVEDDPKTLLLTTKGLAVSLIVDHVQQMNIAPTSSKTTTQTKTALSKGLHQISLSCPQASTSNIIELRWASHGQKPTTIPKSNLIPLGKNSYHKCSSPITGAQK